MQSALISDMHSHNSIRYSFFYALLLGVLLLTYQIFEPYFLTIAIATTFAVVIQPLYKALLRITKNRESLAAILSIIVMDILVLAPLTLLGMQVAREATDLYTKLDESDAISSDFLSTAEAWIEGLIQPYLPTIDINLENILRQSAIWTSAHIGALFASTVQGIIHFFLGIVAFYYLIKDGKKFAVVLTELSPLANKHDKKIFERLNLAINSIVKGSLFIAIIQGITSGIGFAIFGVPSAALWGSMAAIGALVPGVGTAIVIAPAVFYLFFADHTGAAIGLAVWGIAAVGMIDNFLGPMLVGRGVRIHPLFVLFAVIGGIQFFGPLGFILGPLVLSLLYALLDIYRLIASDKQEAL